MGLHQACPEAEIVGVDNKPMPRYPFKFVLADAMIFPLEGFDFIWASPPCQAFTVARAIQKRRHPDLLTPMRQRLIANGAPWAIENVPGAPMRADVLLCGSMFGQPQLKRHRHFELSFPVSIPTPPCAHGKEIISVFGHGGHVYHGVKQWREIMGIDWMRRGELAQAVPPTYSKFIMEQYLNAR